MALTDRPPLSEAEQRMSLAKYYDLPLYPPGPREMQLMRHMPLDPQDALPADRLVDLLRAHRLPRRRVRLLPDARWLQLHGHVLRLPVLHPADDGLVVPLA